MLFSGDLTCLLRKHIQSNEWLFFCGQQWMFLQSKLQNSGKTKRKDKKKKKEWLFCLYSTYSPSHVPSCEGYNTWCTQVLYTQPWLKKEKEKEGTFLIDDRILANGSCMLQYFWFMTELWWIILMYVVAINILCT